MVAFAPIRADRPRTGTHERKGAFEVPPTSLLQRRRAHLARAASSECLAASPSTNQRDRWRWWWSTTAEPVTGRRGAARCARRLPAAPRRPAAARNLGAGAARGSSPSRINTLAEGPRRLAEQPGALGGRVRNGLPGNLFSAAASCWSTSSTALEQRPESAVLHLQRPALRGPIASGFDASFPCRPPRTAISATAGAAAAALRA
jgi:hypothetical protein